MTWSKWYRYCDTGLPLTFWWFVTFTLCFGATIRLNKNYLTQALWYLNSQSNKWDSYYVTWADSVYRMDVLDQGMSHSWMVQDFIPLLRMTWNLKLMNVYFWNFLFNIFRTQLTMGNWSWKVKWLVRGRYCILLNWLLPRTFLTYSWLPFKNMFK